MPQRCGLRLGCGEMRLSCGELRVLFSVRRCLRKATAGSNYPRSSSFRNCLNSSFISGCFSAISTTVFIYSILFPVS